MAQGKSSSAAHSAAVTSDPRCPRCGYALRGAVDTWKDSCPLGGICTECGLDFQWRDVMTPAWAEPRWCVEYGPPRRIPLRALQSLLMTFLPWKMWSQLQMHHEIRPARMAMYMLSFLVVGYVVIALSAGVWAWCYVADFGGPVTTDATPAATAFRAIVLPFSNAPMGTYRVAGQFQTFQMSAIGGVSKATVWQSLKLIRPMGMVLLCSTVAFAALPISRRRAKVRWAHIMRVAAYGVGLLFIMWILLVAVIVLDHIASLAPVGSWIDRVHETIGIIVAFLMLGLLPGYIVWWSLATSRYLKMPHAWGIGFAVVLIGALASMLVMVVTGWIH